MQDWKDEFKRKLISPERAAAFVKSGDFVQFALGREPHSIGLAIAARKEELRGVKIDIGGAGYDFGWYDPGWEESFEISIGRPTAVTEQMADEKRCDFRVTGLNPGVPGPDAPTPDLYLLEVSPPDEKGFCSFGASVWHKRELLRQARLTIAEVNQNLIRTYGDNYVHVSEIDYFVEHLSTGGTPGTGSLGGRVAKQPEPYVRRIAELVSGLIRDGDTIQMGIGRTTEPLVKLGFLDNKKDIGFHSEATPPGIISLVRRGVVNGRCKTVHPGKVVATSIGGGSKEEMEWVKMNPLFELLDVAYVTDIRVIAAHDNMVAINQALSIDLSGQICAESIGTRIMGGAGGQIPFVYGATLSRGGRVIHVIPATAQGGKVSRITPLLALGSTVTIQQNLADYVVTEYGVARLKGKTRRQRAQELISVSHPDFREYLEREARKLFWP
ncbi:MAG: acetyl-CoA hydrolase/transferase C-terminal domain-containing protein [Dehalococcoidia bacterium]|nr:acetyl-CoA hydrolase/transferase C-terminal domain-containing protein [Dehalococcoidia bacterium]